MSSCKKNPIIQGTLPGLGDEIPGADNTDPLKQGAEGVVLMTSCFSRLCCFIPSQVLWEAAGRGANGHHTTHQGEVGWQAQCSPQESQPKPFLCKSLSQKI